jgi:hypothetical protein
MQEPNTCLKDVKDIDASILLERGEEITRFDWGESAS